MRRLALPAFLAAIVILATPAVASEIGPFSISGTPKEPVVSQARALWRGHQFARAQALLAGVLRRHPDDLEANLEMGFVHDYEQREGPSSLPYFQRAAASHPDSLEAQDVYIESLLWAGRYKAALALAETELAVWRPKSPPKDLLALLYVGLGGAEGRMAQRGGLIAALKYGLGVKGRLESAVRIDPDCGLAQYALGRFDLKAPGLVGGSVDRGLVRLRRAISLDPEDYQFQAVYIGALVRHGDHGAAATAQGRYRRAFGDLPGATRALDRQLKGS